MGGPGTGGSVVAALHLESMSSAVHGETRVFVMAVTVNPLRLYLFIGGPTIEVRGKKDDRRCKSRCGQNTPLV